MMFSRKKLVNRHRSHTSENHLILQLCFTHITVITKPACIQVVCSAPQLCLTFCDPMDCSLPGASVHGILQAGTLEWVAIFSSRDLPRPGIESMSLASPALQADSLLLSHQGSSSPVYGLCVSKLSTTFPKPPLKKKKKKKKNSYNAGQNTIHLRNHNHTKFKCLIPIIETLLITIRT